MPLTVSHQYLKPFIIVALLSGCQTWATSDWQGVTPAKAPVAQQVRFAHTVRFQPNESVLSKLEEIQLKDFIDRIRPGARATVSIEGGSGVLDRLRSRTLHDYLSANRVHAQDVALLASGKQATNTQKIVITTHVVSLPRCPDWTSRPGRTWANTVHSNLGCASAVNLGLMLAEPSDLAAGRAIGAADGAVSAAAIARYRAGKVKTTDASSATSTLGSVSAE